MKKRHVILFVALALVLGALGGWIASAISYGDRNGRLAAALALADVDEALRTLKSARSGDTNTVEMLEYRLDAEAMRLAILAQQTKDSDQRDACVRALSGVLDEHRAHPRKSAFPNFDGAIADVLSPKVSR